MQVNSLFGLLGAIVTVALATTIVASPNTYSIIKGFGDAFSGSLLAAQGK